MDVSPEYILMCEKAAFIIILFVFIFIFFVATWWMKTIFWSNKMKTYSISHAAQLIGITKKRLKKLIDCGEVNVAEVFGPGEIKHVITEKEIKRIKEELDSGVV